MYIHVSIYTYIYTYIHIYIYTHTHTHTSYMYIERRLAVGRAVRRAPEEALVAPVGVTATLK